MHCSCHVTRVTDSYAAGSRLHHTTPDLGLSSETQSDNSIDVDDLPPQVSGCIFPKKPNPKAATLPLVRRCTPWLRDVCLQLNVPRSPITFDDKGMHVSPVSPPSLPPHSPLPTLIISPTSPLHSPSSPPGLHICHQRHARARGRRHARSLSATRLLTLPQDSNPLLLSSRRCGRCARVSRFSHTAAACAVLSLCLVHVILLIRGGVVTRQRKRTAIENHAGAKQTLSGQDLS